MVSYEPIHKHQRKRDVDERFLNLLMLNVLSAEGVGSSNFSHLLRVFIGNLVSKGGVRLPSSAGAWSALEEHDVDLLERQALGLRNEKVREDDTGSARTSPDKEHIGAHVAILFVYHVGGDLRDDEVPEPIGRGG
jgi:hypothetical protein